jgi:hypothetical protein
MEKKEKNLAKETDIQKIVNYYFYSKGLSLEKIKESAKKQKIIYSRYTRPAKQLLELAGSVKKAEKAIDKVAQWAQSRDLDYAIETIFKKWLELDRLKPREIVKKPFFQGNPMVWSQTKNKWFVIDETGDWREFVGEEKEIEWKVIKR